MNVSFDIFGNPEIPYIILSNPNKQEMYSLGLAYSTRLSKKFNALSEFKFDFPKSIDGGQTTLEAYDYIENKRLVEIEEHGYFQITNAEEDLTGAIPIKHVTCVSLESELIQKRVTAYGGTKPLWNILDEDNTVLKDMIDLAPNWSVGHVDTDLLLLFRTFSVSDTNIYNFLMTDVSKAFECVFIFDTDARTINAYTLENATTETDIFFSFDNIISSASLFEKSDEIVTALSVYGGGLLNIRNVNPLGTDKIYDFSYYKTTEWMSQELIDSLDAWELVVATQQPIYADNLTFLQTYNGELLTLQATLATLNSEYLTLEGVQKVRIQANQSYADITALMVAKQAEITSQNQLITNKEGQIDSVSETLENINILVSFEENFSTEQLLELNNFMYENTYKNENIIQTDGMTPVEIQEASQSLYDQAVTVLDRISQPRYEFSLDAVNYIDLQEFEVFTEQTQLGSIITSEIKDDVFIESVLLEINMQFDDPSNFSVVLSNRLRLDDESFTYSDLIGQVVKTGSSVAFDSLKWGNWESDYKDEVVTFITSSLNTATNSLISNSNQDITINQNGLRARQFNGTGYDGKQVWLVNNMLAFSTDGFQTSKLALGEITLPSGGTGFGLVGDYLVGRILAGSSLTISNASNNFVLDQTGATLTNAKFSIQTTNTKIIIDPTATNSLTIQKNEGGTFVNKFWVDNSGNVNFSGTLSGANGTFSGTITATAGNIGTLVIDANGLRTSNSANYLRGNGDFKWGALNMTGSTATFSGDIFANRVIGQIVNTQISDGAVTDSKVNTGLSAGKITTGTMSGNRLFGGTPTFTSIDSTGGSLIVNGGFLVQGFSTFSQGAVVDGTLNAGEFYSGNGDLTIATGGINVAGGSGISTSRSISTPSGTRTITFSRGICVGFT